MREHIKRLLLAAAVGAMHESRVRPTAPQRHHQRIMHKFRPLPAAHRPTHHLARVQVEYYNSFRSVRFN